MIGSAPGAVRQRKHVRPRPPHQDAAHRRTAGRVAVFPEGHRHAANGAAPASTWPRTSPRCSTRSLAYVESTYGNSVLDLQSNKVDLAFALNPTPQRALSIGFTHPMIVHPFGCVARKGLDPKTWDDINKPEIRIVYDIGSLHETAAKRYCSEGATDRLQDARRMPAGDCSPAAPTCTSWRRSSAFPTIGKNPARRHAIIC